MRAWLAVVVLGLASPAIAQPRRDPIERRAPPGSPERREQIKNKIRALRAYTLTEQLALDDQTAARLFPALARLDDETDRLLQKRVDLQRRLRRADTMRDPRAIDRLIDEALANQRGFWELEDRRIAELRKILTPAQVARVLVVLPALERRIQNQLRKAITRRGEGRNAAGPSRADRLERDDDDDDDPQADELDAGPRREGALAPGAGPRTPSAPPRSSGTTRAPQMAPDGPPRGNFSNAPGNTAPCDPRAQPCR